jgi:hypothetical protein
MKNNFSGLFLSKNLKIKQQQNQIHFRIWFCVEPPERALRFEAEKKADNADICCTTQPHSSRYSASYHTLFCQLAATTVDTISRHSAK